MVNYDKIIDFYKEYINHYKEILEFQNKKIKYMSKNLIDELKGCVAIEQAYIMKSENFEKRRIKLLKEEGVDSLTFRELIEVTPDEYKQTLQYQYTELLKYVFAIKKINEEAMSVAKYRIKTRGVKSNNTYDQKGGISNLVNNPTLEKNI